VGGSVGASVGFSVGSKVGCSVGGLSVSHSDAPSEEYLPSAQSTHASSDVAASSDEKVFGEHG